MEDAAASLGAEDEARQELAIEEADFRWALLVGILAVAATIAIGDQLESRHMHRIPEAALGVIAGVACAALAKLTHNDDMLRDDTFSAEFFMVWLLPPIIFAAGFNLNIPAFVASISCPQCCSPSWAQSSPAPRWAAWSTRPACSACAIRSRASPRSSSGPW